MEASTIQLPEAPLVEGDFELPRLRPDVSLNEVGPGEYIAKDQRNRSYFKMGSEEHFLLDALTRPTTFEQLKSSFSHRYHEQLPELDFKEFLASIRDRNWLQGASVAEAGTRKTPPDEYDEDEGEDTAIASNKVRGSFLFFRVSLFDPDRFLAAVTRAVPWIWTRTFMIASLIGLAASLCVMLTNGQELVVSFNAALRWETVILVSLTSLLVTALHEIAHGSTCKRFGGKVEESGVLFLLLMPCLYVNVSDAWLIRERWKRMLITAAGGYMDLCLWGLGTILWRLTAPGTLVNHLSFVVLSLCGTRGLINFNPLLRLDGYYLLSDALRFPNFYTIARKYWIGHVNWLLWGAPRPAALPRGRLLLAYGGLSWLFAIAFLNFVLLGVVSFAGNEFGIAGMAFASLLLVYALRRVFRGIIGSEFMKMIHSRWFHTCVWMLGLGVIGLACFLIPMPYYAVGNFEVRPNERTEVPAPIGCFISRVCFEDGAAVQEGDVLVELHSSDLLSKIETKDAELRQTEANLAKLRSGPRQEELLEQTERVHRLQTWVNLGKDEIDIAKTALTHQLDALDHRVKQTRKSLAFLETSFVQSQQLNRQGALAAIQLEQEKVELEVLRERIQEAESQRLSLATQGIRSTIAEFSRREQELADAESKLRLLRLGSRPEEIAAEVAHRELILEELKFLNLQRENLRVLAPRSGLMSAPRLRENIGQYVAQGALLCYVENVGVPRVEVFISEDDAMQVAPGQLVYLKARALPFVTFEGTVERIAANAAKPVQTIGQQATFVGQTVVVHCTVNISKDQLKSGMTGFGRILRGRNAIGTVLATKAYRYLRTEFWW